MEILLLAGLFEDEKAIALKNDMVKADVRSLGGVNREKNRAFPHPANLPAAVKKPKTRYARPASSTADQIPVISNRFKNGSVQ